MLFLLQLLFYDDDGLLSLLFCADVSVLFSSVVLVYIGAWSWLSLVMAVLSYMLMYN
jgi:hypothetical protein